MIKSMTGYGRAKYESEGREYTVEIKSVNNRYSDISIKMPRTISYLEEKVKSEILKVVSRGKIDVFISFYNNSSKGKKVIFNNELAKMYVEGLEQIAESTNINKEIYVTQLAKFPDVLAIENDEDENLIWNELNMPLKAALESFVKMRETEGQKLYQDINKRINNIENIVTKISENSTRLIKDYIVKLETRIKELMDINSIDENRLAQETVIYADKSSVEEEITRLKSHISQLRDFLNANTAIGKKIDFLIQEMNRETNTIGSKSGSIDITNMVIDIKTEIEDIREQVQNIE